MHLCGQISLQVPQPIQLSVMKYPFSFSLTSATQNMDKYTHIEILKVFTNFSYCFILYAFVITK